MYAIHNLKKKAEQFKMNSSPKKLKFAKKLTHPQAIQDVDEFVLH